MSEPVVRVDGLSKRCGEGVLAVDHFSFEVERGQVSACWVRRKDTLS